MFTSNLFFIKALIFLENVLEGFSMYGIPNANANSFSVSCVLLKLQSLVLLKLRSSNFVIILLINQLG